MTDEKHLRKIKSFVKRSGRLSKAQAIGLNELWNDYGVNITKWQTYLILMSSFSNPNNDITLEVGFGNGDSLLEMAIQQSKPKLLRY